MTRTQQIIAALLASGWTERPQSHRKLREFVHPDGLCSRYVNKSGRLYIGTSPFNAKPAPYIEAKTLEEATETITTRRVA